MSKKESDEPLIQLDKRIKWALWFALILWMLIVPTGIAQAEELVPPETIRVRITGRDVCGTGRFSNVEVMNFKEYVKGVLAGEWGNRWHTNSLRAGAVAVKMYAWDAINMGGKYPAMPWAQDRVGDVYDCNWDQVYKPTWRTAKSDKAVDDTWDYVLMDLSDTVVLPPKVFQTYHKAWDFGCQISSPEGTCMGQWNSLYLAQRGMDWTNILMTYYPEAALINPYIPGGYVQEDIWEELDHQKVEGEYDTHLVKAGDSLIKIAREVYGDENMYQEIFKLNSDFLYNPDLIRTGLYLNLPPIGE